MLKPVSYSQNDKRWASHDYSAKGEKRTISSSGCGPTCMAMVVSSLAKKSITPVTMADWSVEYGYKFKNQGTAYGYFAKQAKVYGLTVNQMNNASAYKNKSASVHKTAKKALQNGDWLICCMGPGNWTSGGHYVLVYAISDTKVYINDPASLAVGRTISTWSKLSNEVKYYFRVSVPEYKVATKANPLGIYKEKSLKSQRTAKVKKGSKMKLIKLGDDTFNAYTDGVHRGYSRKKYLKKI